MEPEAVQVRLCRGVPQIIITHIIFCGVWCGALFKHGNHFNANGIKMFEMNIAALLFEMSENPCGCALCLVRVDHCHVWKAFLRTIGC